MIKIYNELNYVERTWQDAFLLEANPDDSPEAAKEWKTIMKMSKKLRKMKKLLRGLLDCGQKTTIIDIIMEVIFG